MASVYVRLNPIGAAVFMVGFLFTLVYLFGMPDIFKREQRVSMRELLETSIKLAKRGGGEAKQVYLRYKQSNQSVQDMLGVADLEAHKAIFYGFSKMYSGIKILSEEHDNKPVDLNQIQPVTSNIEEVEDIIKSDQSIPVNRIATWIDPLNARQEYTEGQTDYVTTMICIVVDGEPKIGVIYRPFHDETFWAWDGYGHSTNLKQAETFEKSSNEKQIIVSLDQSVAVEKITKSTFDEEVKVVSAGGAGYKTLEVIKGTVHAYAHISMIKKWDICAGNAILNALGGKMTTLDGDFVDYSPFLEQKNERGLLATINSKLHYLYLEKLGPKVKDLISNKNMGKSSR